MWLACVQIKGKIGHTPDGVAYSARIKQELGHFLAAKELWLRLKLQYKRDTLEAVNKFTSGLILQALRSSRPSTTGGVINKRARGWFASAHALNSAYKWINLN